MIIEVYEGVAIDRSLAESEALPGSGRFASLDGRSAVYQLGVHPVAMHRRAAAGVDIGAPGTPRAILVFLAAAAAMSVIEFSYQGYTPDVAGLARAGGASVGAIANGAWWKLITSNLLHGSVMHLLMNAVIIYVMGHMLEHVVGWRITAVVIAWSALIASAGALAIGSAAVTIGASGVAFGITGAALAVDPRAKTILGITARPLILLNLVFTFLGPNVSVGGHAGGLVAGLLVGAACWRGRLGAAPDVAVDPRIGTPSVLGEPRPLVTAALGLLTLPLYVVLLIGPPALGGAAPGMQEAIVAPLLERQVADAISAGERSDERRTVTDGSCERDGSPRTYRCTFEVDGQDVVAHVAFRRSDDQWRATYEAP